MARIDTPATENATPVVKTAAERLAASLGAFKTVETPATSPYAVKRKELENEVKNIFVGQLASLQRILGDGFAGAGDQDAAAKTAASLRRAQTSALKAVRSISDDTLKAREAGEVVEDALAE